jgi:hypothetical protein
VDGLISNWLLDQKYFPLGREAERMVDQYLAGLGVARPADRRAAPAKRARRAGGLRAARAA